MYFKVVMEGGHVGAGKSCEMVRYFEADNAIVLLRFLEDYPALKSKNRGGGISLVKPISREEYKIGMSGEVMDPYSPRRTVRFDIVETCLLKAVSGDTPCSKGIEALAVNYSTGGMGVRCNGEVLPVGSIIEVTVDTLKILSKKAKISWIKNSGNGDNLLGLNWLNRH